MLHLYSYPLNKSMLFFLIFFIFSAGLSAQKPFITVWETANNGVSGKNEIQLPAEGNYSYTWEEIDHPENHGSGEGSGPKRITFPSAGTYRLKIRPSTGDHPFDRIKFEGGKHVDFYTTIEDDNKKLLRIEQWGRVKWKSMANAFRGTK